VLTDLYVSVVGEEIQVMASNVGVDVK